MLVISLSTIPSRFDAIGETLESLLHQSAQVDEIRLYIPHHYRRFPDYDGHLPKVPKGITIHRPDVDLGPATKILYAAQDLADKPDAKIIFCDDDRYFAPDWAQGLVDVHLEHPNSAVCISGFHFSSIGVRETLHPHFMPRAVMLPKNRDWEYQRTRIVQRLKTLSLQPAGRRPARKLVKKGGYVDVFEGVGGVLVRPGFFDAQSFEIPPVGFFVDDIWLSGAIVRSGASIWCAEGLYSPQTTLARKVDPLYSVSFDGMKRDELNKACIKHLQDNFGIWT